MWSLKILMYKYFMFVKTIKYSSSRTIIFLVINVSGTIKSFLQLFAHLSLTRNKTKLVV